MHRKSNLCLWNASLPTLLVVVAWTLLILTGCGSSEETATAESGGPGGHGAPPQGGAKGGPGRGSGGGPPWAAGGGGSPETAAVPVEVVAVERRSVSAFLETNGSLEAENEVDIVARTSGPIVELAAEEGMRIRKGQLLARLDKTEYQAQVEIAKVTLAEASRTFDRAQAARESEIISQEVFDTALARKDSAEAQLKGSEILLAYTDVVAPFDGIVIERYVKLAENVTPNQRLFRVSDFDPLLCKIQVPEKELSRLRVGQPAFVNVEAWPGERFDAKVLRVSPVVDPATGTIRVTLQVGSQGKLSPGMFASVFLITETHHNALVMPRHAISLESLSDTVFVVADGKAERRSLELGYQEDQTVEVLSGLSEGERVIVVGQDGLTDGTPVQILKGPGADEAPATPARSAGRPRGPEGPSAQPGAPPDGPRGGPGRNIDFNNLSPEELDRVKERMRARGMSDQQIEEIIKRRRGQQ